MGRDAKFALVCVNITGGVADRLFYYSVPATLEHIIAAGMRVSVPFGNQNKPTLGYVTDLVDNLDLEGTYLKDSAKIKAISGLYEDYPVFSQEMLTLAQWMKDKYYTTLINCLRCIQPPALGTKPVMTAEDPLPDISLPEMSLPQEPLSTITAPEAESPFELLEEQKNAVGYIADRLKSGDIKPILIHGVTGSGKTEIYLRVITKTMEMGRQAIMLVPEIALTPQTVAVFKERFGTDAAVTHSRLTAKERHIQWQKARKGEVSVMIGPRSAVFTPFSRLGIIIIDEEHENTYRSDLSPKFDTRDVAIKRGKLTGALVVMGSATPNLTTYYRAEKKEFTLLTLSRRVNAMFPKVHIVDMRRELAEGNTSIFGQDFKDAISKTLDAGKQVILFLNRRGHSSFVSCRRCGYVMGCDKCRVNFTYHAATNRLLCHYCTSSSPLPHLCPSCQSPFISYFGVGTQKVEESVKALFPLANTLRMDMDTTKSRQSHSKILSAFKKGEAQILIGTQMIAKGLDFPNVTLAGIVAADLSLFTGDFRAAEYTFQLLTQVSGRAGRADQMGQVYIQTYNPDHYSITLAQKADYSTFYEQELFLRRTMKYPPFSHVFMVLFTGPDERDVIKALHKLSAVMEYCNKKKNFEILGPAPAFVSKIKLQFRWRLLVKCSQEEMLKAFVLYCLGKLRENDPLTSIVIQLTLDPVTIE